MRRCPVDGGGRDHAYATHTKYHPQFLDILSYAHLCEVMPWVRKGRYVVEVTDGVFQLSHRPETLDAEQKDVVLVEMSIPYATRPDKNVTRALYRAVDPIRSMQFEDYMDRLVEHVSHYRSGIFEPELVSDSSFKAGFGFERSAFKSVRAALFAVSELAIAASYVAKVHYENQSDTTLKGRLADSSIRWGAPTLKIDAFVDLLHELSAANRADILAVLRAFAVDASDEAQFDRAGDGYAPPFFIIRDEITFTPFAVTSGVSERNLLYLLNKSRQSIFDDVVSQSLEPTLINQAVECIARMPGLTIKSNVVWDNGEIDILVFDPGSKTILDIQAKATILPQGARMTRNLEARTKEARRQCDRIRNMSDAEKRRLFSKMLGVDVGAANYVHAILERDWFRPNRG